MPIARADPCTPPHNCPFVLIKGCRKLDKPAMAQLATLSAISCVYVVTRNKQVQYVGEATKFGDRFQKGIKNSEHYAWAQSAGNFNVDAWEMPNDAQFRNAVECEVAFRIRLLGAWPVDLKKIAPHHWHRGEPSIWQASFRASEIVQWLISNRGIAQQPEDAAFLNTFEMLDKQRHPS